jgi:hypothetical protein
MDENYLYIAAALGLLAIVFIYLFYFKDNSSEKKSVSFNLEETNDTSKCEGEKCFSDPNQTNKKSNCDDEKCVLI